MAIPYKALATGLETCSLFVFVDCKEVYVLYAVYCLNLTVLQVYT